MEPEIETFENEEEKEPDFRWEIPICCREGWDTCIHTTKRDDKPKKTNIGL
jgi:hypothetical protein